MAERVFAMPDLGEGLEEGEIVAWLVAEGDKIALNQPLVEVETAKATVEIPSPFVGKVATLHGKIGDAVPVGAPLVTFEVETAERDAAPPQVAPIPAVATTPAVRKLAKDLGVDLSTVAGSGAGGRITSDDVQRASAGPSAPVGAEVVEITAVRRDIARRLTDVAAIPQVTTFRSLECSALDAFRHELEISPLPVIVAALAQTCAGHPLMNSAWGTGGIHLFRDVHVGVATDTERGLMVPVIRYADALTIGELAKEIKRLAEAARGGHLRVDDLKGATISVSNTGSYGSEAGTPLLNPGNAVTLAIGVIQPRAIVIEGAVVARPACTLSLTFDHRVLDGAAVGRALTDLVDVLQDPSRLRDLPR